jgi:hypothetical protein
MGKHDDMTDVGNAAVIGKADISSDDLKRQEINLEVLKLAYDIALKTDGLSKYQPVDERMRVFKEILELAKVHLEFVIHGRDFEWDNPKKLFSAAKVAEYQAEMQGLGIPTMCMSK